jgi:phytoene dehydrogenase-like protein
LRQAPKFKTQAGYEDINQAFRLNIGFDTPDDYGDVLADVRQGRLPEKLAFIASVPTWFDPSQAPSGHTAFLWALVPYRLKNGASWDEVRDEYARRYQVQPCAQRDGGQHPGLGDADPAI